MKKTLALLVVIVLAGTFAFNVQAQDEKTSSSWDTGLDIYSSYIWRGAKFGSGPAFQPYVEYSTGGFALGAWGSVSSSTDESLEMDLYASYSAGPVSFTLTDYYFGGDWTKYSMNHYLEPSVGISAGDFSFTGAYMFLPETGTESFGASGDTYLEAGYSFSHVDLTLGAGDGQYTDNGDFNICNITVGTSKEVKLSETFSLPVSGSVTLNPSTGGFFIAVGLSL
ncbi:MAG TPA: hypothetical protein VKA27_07500 [Sunxiuqinia sp.]|nr:hypothetical protein [Sunxiuqinia sp.]